MNYMEIHKKNYPYVVTIADKPFYKELNLWLRQNYKIVNDPMPDGPFQFDSLEDMVEFKLKWL